MQALLKELLTEMGSSTGIHSFAISLQQTCWAKTSPKTAKQTMITAEPA
jgi:hypothetical protein